MTTVCDDFNRAVREAAFVAFCRAIEGMENDPEVVTEDDWLGVMDERIEDEIEDVAKDIFGSISRKVLIREMRKHIAERFDDYDLGLRIAEEENDEAERRYNEMLAGEE